MACSNLAVFPVGLTPLSDFQLTLVHCVLRIQRNPPLQLSPLRPSQALNLEAASMLLFSLVAIGWHELGVLG